MTSQEAGRLSRATLLGGPPARRAGALLFAIENRTAYAMVQTRRAAALMLSEAAESPESNFLDALAQGRDRRLQPTIYDLERHAPHWAALVPPDPNLRAAMIHLIGKKYSFTHQSVPGLRIALGLDTEVVQEAYARFYNQPLATLYATHITPLDRLRWGWTALTGWMENLPPFWVACIGSLPIGAITLALPIALAAIGPLPGVVFLVVLGVLNILTIAALAEAVARNGAIRYGNAFLGRVVQDYLGSVGSLVMSLVLIANTCGLLLAFYLGVARTLADATGVPAPAWAGLLFLIGIIVLARGSLNTTIGSLMVERLVSTVLVLILSLIAFTHVRAENLLYTNLPVLNGQPFQPSVLQLVFGVGLGIYFAHMGVGNFAKLSLTRDPSGRSLIWGHVACVAIVMVVSSIWVLAVNGAIGPVALASETGTALVPLAKRMGPGVQVIGSIFAVLSMGMASIFFSLSLMNLVRERLPARTEQSVHGLGSRARFLVSASPVILVFLLAEWLFFRGGGSFAGVLGFLGVITAAVAAGIFPVLMLAASRRKGDVVISTAFRWLGHPATITILYLLFLSLLFLHGLVIWDDPWQRAGVLAVGVLMIGMTVAMVRAGVFRPRAIIELCVEQHDTEQVVISTVANGKPISAQITFSYDNREDNVQAAPREARPFANLRATRVELPATSAHELKVWAHRISPNGDSEELPSIVDISCGSETHHTRLGGSAAYVVLPITGNPCQVMITPEAAHLQVSPTAWADMRKT